MQTRSGFDVVYNPSFSEFVFIWTTSQETFTAALIYYL